MGNIYSKKMSDVQQEVQAIKKLLKESVEAIIANLAEIERNKPAGISASWFTAHKRYQIGLC